MNKKPPKDAICDIHIVSDGLHPVRCPRPATVAVKGRLPWPSYYCDEHSSGRVALEAELVNKRDHVVATLDAYLAQGYEVKQLGGAAGDDWRELRIILQRPIPADHTHREVLGGATTPFPEES